ncbi:MAG: helix-turn-helix domain-containing protein [Nanoarchaeota archaeon]|nr:helix-turn-helix domain-containing protein [Nanoarchaeota archaeon]
MGKKYLLFSLDDEKSKYLAEILGNKSCKRIIDLIAEEKQTETDISKKLSMPINSVEYNLKKLISAGIVEKSNDFFWSVKGKKIPVYQLSNKDIIISPKKTKYNILKKFVPVVFISGLGALAIKFFSDQTINNVSERAVASTPLMSGAERASESYLTNTSFNIFNSSPEIWFLAGALFSLAIFIIINKLIERRSNL